MFSAEKQEFGEPVLASRTDPSEGPFICPHCKENVVLKRGLKITHHFAHYPSSKCPLANGESIVHLNAKWAIYNQLKGRGGTKYLTMEKDLGLVVADVYAEYKDFTIAVEIQKSNLTLSELIERTKRYKKLGIYVLWLVPYEEQDNITPYEENPIETRYTPSIWEKWLHYLNGGVIYYITQDADILPVKFRTYGFENNIPLVGVNLRLYKKYVVPIYREKINLTNSFKRANRSEYTGDERWKYIPDSNILVDIMERETDKDLLFLKYWKTTSYVERICLMQYWKHQGYTSNDVLNNVSKIVYVEGLDKHYFLKLIKRIPYKDRYINLLDIPTLLRMYNGQTIRVKRSYRSRSRPQAQIDLT